MSVNELAPRRDDRAAVEKALNLLEVLGSSGSSTGLSALARRAQLPKSTAFRLLATLERTQAVVRVGNEYRIGPLMERLGATPTPTIHEALRDRVTPFMVELYGQTHETVHLAVLSGAEVVYLNKLAGHRRMETPSRIGGRLPAYATAVGKAMLARNPLALNLTMSTTRPALTDNTITDAQDLEHELTRIREIGIAHDHGETLRDLHCVAAPIIGPNGHPVAALSVSGPRGLFDADQHTRRLRRMTYSASRAIANMGREVAAASVDVDKRIA